MTFSQKWTVQSILQWSSDYFRTHHIESPDLDARLLLGDVLGLDKIGLIIHAMRPLDAQELASYRAHVVARVKDRIPTAYILGHRDFWSLDLCVTPDVLIPRPDTECVVEKALDFLQARMKNRSPLWLCDSAKISYEKIDLHHANDQDLQPDDPVVDEPESLQPVSVVDVGTGSGAIILAIAKELQKAPCRCTGLDISPKSLDVARINAQRNHVEGVEWIASDLLAQASGPFTLIVSNPPYITDDEMEALSPEVQHEPSLALRGGPKGIDVYTKLTAQAFDRLIDGGALITEIGATQKESVEALFRAAGFDHVQTFKDYGQRPRVVFGLKSTTSSLFISTP